jgi:hypothetical protein
VQRLFLRGNWSFSTARQIDDTLTDRAHCSARCRRNSSNVASGCVLTSPAKTSMGVPASAEAKPPRCGLGLSDPVLRRRAITLLTKDTLTPKRSATSSIVSTPSSYAVATRLLKSTG